MECENTVAHFPIMVKFVLFLNFVLVQFKASLVMSFLDTIPFRCLAGLELPLISMWRDFDIPNCLPMGSAESFSSWLG